MIRITDKLLDVLSKTIKQFKGKHPTVSATAGSRKKSSAVDPVAAKNGPLFGEVPDVPSPPGEPSSSFLDLQNKRRKGEVYMFVISVVPLKVINLIWKLISSVHITYVKVFSVQRRAASKETRASQVKGT